MGGTDEKKQLFFNSSLRTSTYVRCTEREEAENINQVLLGGKFLTPEDNLQEEISSPFTTVKHYKKKCVNQSVKAKFLLRAETGLVLLTQGILTTPSSYQCVETNCFSGPFKSGTVRDWENKACIWKAHTYCSKHDSENKTGIWKSEHLPLQA